MEKLLKILPYILLAYVAMYSTIWLHEFGHSLVYHYFECKQDVFNVFAPAYFANANPSPVDETKSAALEPWQYLYVSLAGIAINLILALSAWLLLQLKFKKPQFLYFFITIFLLSNLLEAATYLTISNIYPLSDIIGVQQYNPTLRVPLFLLGLLLIYGIIALIMNAPKIWRKGMIFFSIATALSMGGLRLLFTIF